MNVDEALEPAPSLTEKTIRYVVSTNTVGNLPLARRVDDENEIPAGNPARLYEYGVLPPDAAGNTVSTTPPEGTRKSETPDSDNGGRGGGAGGTIVARNVTEAEPPALSRAL